MRRIGPQPPRAALVAEREEHDRLVLAAIVRYGAKGASLPEIADDCGARMSTPEAHNAVRRLEQAGVIVRGEQVARGFRRIAVSCLPAKERAA